jgi:hypothetical protein
VCVKTGTTQEAVIQELLPGPAVIPFSVRTDAIVYMNDGTCNVIVGEAMTLNPTWLQQVGLFQNIDYKLGTNTFYRDPFLSIVTRDWDHEWSDIIHLVIQIVYTAEAMNLTKDNVHTTITDDVVGTYPQIHEELSNRII